MLKALNFSSEERFWQALHGLYIPHSQVEHEILPKEFPSYTYNGGSSTDCLLVDICGDMNRPCNEYDPKHLMRAFPSLFLYGVGGFGMVRPVTISFQRQLAAFDQRSDGRYAKPEVV